MIKPALIAQHSGTRGKSSTATEPSMNWADIIAERRAADAVANGALSGLPGEGSPLDLSEDVLVPPEVRALMRTLKHAGFTPPEIAAMKAIANIEKELAALPESERVEKAKALVARIAVLREAKNCA
jgi:Domain of unknown function (DUF1992)